MKLSLKNEEELNFKRLIDSWNGSNNSDKNEILLHLRNELRKMQIDHEECIKRSEELESDLSRAKLRLKAIEITEAMKGVN